MWNPHPAAWLEGHEASYGLDQPPAFMSALLARPARGFDTSRAWSLGAARKPIKRGVHVTRKPRKVSRRAQRRLVERRSTQCLFCDNVGGLTEQHVFDDWLNQLGFGSEGLRELVEAAEPERRILQPGGPFSKTLRIVCDPCNGIWLSGIEKRAGPLLMKMFNGERVRLDTDGQLALARWAFKVICVLSQLGRIKTFPLDQFREFRSSDLPPASSQIWIGSASVTTEELGEHLVDSRHEPKKAVITHEGGVVVNVPCYSARFRLLNVVFDVFGHVPTTGVGMRADLSDDLRRALLAIWPSEHETIWWPPIVSLDVIGGVGGLAAVPLIGVPSLDQPPTD
jgi:hypothetical protein